MKKETQKVMLGSGDACLVFRENCGIELFLPKQNEEEEALDVSLIVTALATRLTEEKEFVLEQVNWLNERVKNQK